MDLADVASFSDPPRSRKCLPFPLTLWLQHQFAVDLQQENSDQVGNNVPLQSSLPFHHSNRIVICKIFLANRDPLVDQKDSDQHFNTEKKLIPTRLVLKKRTSEKGC
jgi:hypothetical protein